MMFEPSPRIPSSKIGKREEEMEMKNFGREKWESYVKTGNKNQKKKGSHVFQKREREFQKF